jgi:septal ring factor EnvC (AmiA/AmiB activator)
MPTKSNKTAAKSGFSAKPQPRPEEAATPAATPATPAATTGADPTKAIAELQAQLTAATTQGTALQQTIADLESKLSAQAKTVETLKTEAKAFTNLQTTLEKAEAAARQLAALNNTLLAENSALKAAAEAAPVATPKSTALAPAASNRSVNSMMHPVFPNGPLPGGLGEQEIGWFD